MTILINGKQAIIKEKSSFQIVSENRYFTGSDSYSLGIVFPLKDCPKNLAIFGSLNRKDVNLSSLLYDCEIRDKSMVKRGSLSITSVTDVVVQAQFLEGQCVTNFIADLDNIYINSLDLGYPDRDPSNYAPNHYMAKSIDNGLNFVALPWVNNSSGNIQNRPVPPSNWQGPTQWHSETTALSFQPYLIYLTKLMCDAIGYSYDFAEWEDSPYRYLIVCNTLPAAWDVLNWARALPKMTMAEFLEQLEYFMDAEFLVDNNNRKITFHFFRKMVEMGGDVELTTITDDYEVEIQDASDCKYRGAVNLKYEDCDHRMWKYYSCKWLVDKFKNEDFIYYNAALNKYYNQGRRFYRYNYLQRLYMDMYWWQDWYEGKEGASQNGDGLFYSADYDVYFILKENSSYTQDGKIHHINYLQAVNQFGEYIVNPDAETIELKLSPAWLDEAWADGVYQGVTFFLECGEYNGSAVGGVIPYNYAQAVLDAGKPEETFEEYLDKLYLGFWDGSFDSNMAYTLCYPTIDLVTDRHDMDFDIHNRTMRLHSAVYSEFQNPYSIDTAKKYKFNWLGDTIPNVRSVFYIQGQRYLCAKITATFTENGMSQLLKGEFYRIID